jgi:release factor glutamine methyltransferase
MTIAEWLVDSMVKLNEAKVPSGRTDSLILLADLFDKDKSWIHTHPEVKLDDLQVRELNYKLEKRLQHIPLAYIRGFIEFYLRRFMVNSNVLIPRPESESFIEILKSLKLEMPVIADIGTGSGVLGITAALQVPEATVHLYDIDPKAMAVAYYNASQYDLLLHYYESDLLNNLQPTNYDLIMANLPYVPNDLITSPEIEKEPKIALFSGDDGLDEYREFWSQIKVLGHHPQYIMTESLESQHKDMKTLGKKAGYKLQQTDVLVQLFSKGHL